MTVWVCHLFDAFALLITAKAEEMKKTKPGPSLSTGSLVKQPRDTQMLRLDLQQENIREQSNMVDQIVEFKEVKMSMSLFFTVNGLSGEAERGDGSTVQVATEIQPDGSEICGRGLCDTREEERGRHWQRTWSHPSQRWSTKAPIPRKRARTQLPCSKSCRFHRQPVVNHLCETRNRWLGWRRAWSPWQLAQIWLWLRSDNSYGKESPAPSSPSYPSVTMRTLVHADPWRQCRPHGFTRGKKHSWGLEQDVGKEKKCIEHLRGNKSIKSINNHTTVVGPSLCRTFVILQKWKKELLKQPARGEAAGASQHKQISTFLPKSHNRCCFKRRKPPLLAAASRQDPINYRCTLSVHRGQILWTQLSAIDQSLLVP